MGSRVMSTPARNMPRPCACKVASKVAPPLTPAPARNNMSASSMSVIRVLRGI